MRNIASITMKKSPVPFALSFGTNQPCKLISSEVTKVVHFDIWGQFVLVKQQDSVLAYSGNKSGLTDCRKQKRLVRDKCKRQKVTVSRYVSFQYILFIHPGVEAIISEYPGKVHLTIRKRLFGIHSGRSPTNRKQVSVWALKKNTPLLSN